MMFGCFSLTAFLTGPELMNSPVIFTKLLSILRFWFMLLKRVLKVSDSLWLFVIALFLSFSIIVSLRNVFFGNSGLIVGQSFLLLEITLLFICLLDFCIIAALRSFAFARIYFLFINACLSSAVNTVLVNSTKSALL